jgi:hypothetical protein
MKKTGCENMWLINDIISKINEFITDFNTLFILHKTCKKFFYYKFINITVSGDINLLPDIGNVTDVIINKNIRLLNRPFHKIDDLIYLDCGRSNNMTCYTLKNLTKLTYLNCGNNRFKDRLLEHLHDLKYLKINMVSNFTDDSFKKLTKLVYLSCPLTDVMSSRITNLSLKYLTNLTHLDYTSNIYNINESLSKLTNLTHLSCNKYVDNTTILSLPKLISLDITRTHNVYNSTVARLTNLVHLGCNTGVSGNTLLSLHNLISLDLGNNMYITDEILSKMTNLKKLKCGEQGRFFDDNEGLIYITDATIYNLTNLTHLDCGIHPITRDSIICLTNLVELRCHYSYKKAILKNLPNIKKILYVY